MSYAIRDKKVFVAGHRGLVGSAIVRRLAGEGCEILTAGRDEADLCTREATRAWFAANRPDAVIFANAKVGGIQANVSRPTNRTRSPTLAGIKLVLAFRRQHGAPLHRLLARQSLRLKGQLRACDRTRPAGRNLGDHCLVGRCARALSGAGRLMRAFSQAGFYGPRVTGGWSGAHVLTTTQAHSDRKA